MFKIFALVFVLASGGEQPTGLEFKHKAAFPDKESCEAFLASNPDAQKDAVQAVFDAKGKEDGVAYKVHFECRAFDDGSL